MKKKIKLIFINLLKSPVYFYKYCISPLIPHSCKFYPTCSCYMLDAINQFGIIGVFKGLKRVSRCNPWNKNSGYDPVPINIKGEIKWLRKKLR